MQAIMKEMLNRLVKKGGELDRTNPELSLLPHTKQDRILLDQEKKKSRWSRFINDVFKALSLNSCVRGTRD